MAVNYIFTIAAIERGSGAVSDPSFQPFEARPELRIFAFQFLRGGRDDRLRGVRRRASAPAKDGAAVRSIATRSSRPIRWVCACSSARPWRRSRTS